MSYWYLTLQLALSVKPNFSQSLNNLGVVFTVQVSIYRLFTCILDDHILKVDDISDFTQGKMDAAASMIEKAIVSNPTYAEAYNNLGLFFFLISIGILYKGVICYCLLALPGPVY